MFQYLDVGDVVAYSRRVAKLTEQDLSGSGWMLKITRVANGELVFNLSGRMDAENVGEMETLLSEEPRDRMIVLDLKDLRLVDQDVVTFLGAARPVASSSRIALHTSVSGSMENGSELRN